MRIPAARHGATGKNGVYICGGTLDITAGQDGLHAENDEDTTRGMVVISSGSVRIAADGDGIDAGGTLAAISRWIARTTRFTATPM